MGEACRIAHVPPHTLRYWERQFGALRPARRSSGHRRYSRQDILTIFKIKELVVEKKMTIAGARRALNEKRKPAYDPAQGELPLTPGALKILREVRREIRALVDELSR